jgi:hypothetical protein
MKKGLLVLATAIVLGIIAAAAVCWFSHRESSEDWFREKFGLSQQQAQQAAALHQEFKISCAEMCARIEQTDARLAKAIQASDGMTPEIRTAIAETETIRTECRANMLEYFYKTAATLPSTKKQAYLNLVLPTVLEPGEMSGTHRQ